MRLDKLHDTPTSAHLYRQKLDEILIQKSMRELSLKSSISLSVSWSYTIASSIRGCEYNYAHTVIWFIFVLKIISVFNFGGDLISFL